jgi:hypothetical protein
MAVPALDGLLISDEVVDIFLPVRFYWLRRSGMGSIRRWPVFRAATLPSD